MVSTSPRTRLVWIAAATLTAAALALYAFRLERPGLQATIPRNADPRVKYVGDEACRACHASYSDAYAQHPMGRSLATVAQASPIERFDPAARDPFAVGGYRYDARREDQRMFHGEARIDQAGEVVVERTEEVHYAVGSGQRGRSYLIESAGGLRMSPLTWYPEKNLWDLSPGYEKSNQHFNRPVLAACLFCHSNRAHDLADTMSQYEKPVFAGQSIGCERCHGPGELHVARYQGRAEARTAASPADDTIVNPARLTPDLREAVCQQCHLSGKARVLPRGRDQYDYRPGLPLDDFIATFVEPGAGGRRQFVGHVEQMHASRCFLESDGRLGCTSCHDPHRLPPATEKHAYYDGRCRTCHEPAGDRAQPQAASPRKSSCSIKLPLAADQPPLERCTACHMPAQQTQINHTATTDHRVPRRPDDPPAAEPARDALERFGRKRGASGGATLAPDDARDLGLAFVMTAESPEQLRQALELLRAAAERHPDDVRAVEGYAFALNNANRLEESLARYEQVLALRPRREFALAGAALAAQRLGRLSLAEGYWRQAIDVSPSQVRYRIALAKVCLDRGAWRSCVEAAREALDLQPASPQSRQYLTAALLRVGETDEARRQFEVLLRLEPPDPDALRRWFEEELTRGRAKSGE